METQDPVAAYLKTKKAPAGDDPVAAYLATKKPTGHAGKPFVDAPEMLDRTKTSHAGKAFIDAEPEPSGAQQTLGAMANIGRFAADDLATGARAVTRDHGIVDYVKELGNTKGGDVLKALKYGPLGLATLSSDAMKRTPSYIRAHEDIRKAEDSSGDVGSAYHVAGGLASLAPLAPSAAGAVRSLANGSAGTLADVGLSLVPGLGGGARRRLMGKAVGGLRGLMAEAGKPAATAAESVAPAEGLQGPMDSVLEAVKAQRSAPSSVVEAVKAPRQSHRTQASFRDMAERMGEPPRPASLESMGLEGVENTPISGAPKSSALDTQLQEMWAKSKKLNPGEVGATFGDAEEAMGLAEHQQPDLMALLRHSIIAKGGVPRVP